jgi:hypothetical protein
MAYYVFLKSLRSLEEFRKNSHVKIPTKSPCTNFQSCQKFKFQIKIQKGFITRIGPSFGFRPSRGPFPFSFPNRPLSLSPLGLSLSADPARPLGPAGHASVAPCPIAASLAGKRLTSRCLHPSLCLADRWAPPIITFLRLFLSSAVPPPPTTTQHLEMPPPCRYFPPAINPPLTRH